MQILKVVNLLIYVSNFFNFEHFDKSNFSGVVRLSIDIGSSFTYEHANKHKY
jgi:hypothetical protein